MMSTPCKQLDQIRETLHRLNTIIESGKVADLSDIQTIRPMVKEAGANLMRLQVTVGGLQDHART
jgi:hypothetical protein